MNKFIICLLTLFTFSSCSGYRIPNRTNPLKIYGIKSLAIPMFVNHTSLPNVSGPMTTEIKTLMMDFVDLKVRSSFDNKSDAVLIGILTSASNRKETIKNTATQFTTGDLESSIGSRNEFYIPSQSQINLSLRLILIKKPNRLELKLMKSSLNKFMKSRPKNKIVFNEVLSLSGSYSRVIDDTLSVDKGGVVNFTKNKQAEENTIRTMSQSAALNFKDVILNAF